MRLEPGAHLWDASVAARLVQEFIRGKIEADFTTDLVVRSAVERQLEVLGESLNRLRRDDAETAARILDIEKIVGMRNILAHEYGDIDYEIVWRAASTGIPGLIPILRGLPPRMRGAPRRARLSDPRPRLIPADAGRTRFALI